MMGSPEPKIGSRFEHTEKKNLNLKRNDDNKNIIIIKSQIVQLFLKKSIYATIDHENSNKTINAASEVRKPGQQTYPSTFWILFSSTDGNFPGMALGCLP
jgi:hypothetical protein